MGKCQPVIIEDRVVLRISPVEQSPSAWPAGVESRMNANRFNPNITSPPSESRAPTPIAVAAAKQTQRRIRIPNL